MKFTKMHGCGNDYIYVNGYEENVPDDKKSGLVRKISDRHCGVGSDGVIFINPCEDADFEMEMYNADGSRGEMCGNGIRCVAKYVYEKGMTTNRNLWIKSCDRFITTEIITQEKNNGEIIVQKNDAEGAQMQAETVSSVRVNMGQPLFAPEQIPVTECESRDYVLREPIQVAGRIYEMTCVSMGNPHAVVFVENLQDFPVEQIGPWFEVHPRFPKRINVEFVEVIDKTNINMRVWERGTGETLACGTGACASVAACILNQLTDSKVVVKLLGGQLEVFWDRSENVIYMEGPAVTVFEGEWTW